MENKKQKDRNFLGVWIPKDVYLNKSLSWLEKILLVEIESLDNEHGCFASNDYFAAFLDVTKTTISSAISKLKSLGFVEQVSFDGRRRVLKICEAAYKKTEMQPKSKVETSINQNLEHSNTINKTNINSNKKIKNKTKSFLNLDIKDQKKIHDIQDGSICIEVDELKNSQVWLESTARHLKVSMFWINTLLKEFISEQKLKDDSFKSFRETKSHFLNWSKIQIQKNRRTDDRWGRVDPSHTKMIKPKQEVKKEISEEEKKKIHNDFIKSNLIEPFNRYIETDNFTRVRDFGSLVSNELKKHGLLFEDKSEIAKFEKQVQPKTQNKKLNNGRIGSMMPKNRSSNLVKDYILKRSFEMMKENKVDLEKIVLR